MTERAYLLPESVLLHLCCSYYRQGVVREWLEDAPNPPGYRPHPNDEVHGQMMGGNDTATQKWMVIAAKEIRKTLKRYAQTEAITAPVKSRL